MSSSNDAFLKLVKNTDRLLSKALRSYKKITYNNNECDVIYFENIIEQPTHTLHWLIDCIFTNANIIVSDNNS